MHGVKIEFPVHATTSDMISSLNCKCFFPYISKKKIRDRKLINAFINSNVHRKKLPNEKYIYILTIPKLIY